MTDFPESKNGSTAARPELSTRALLMTLPMERLTSLSSLFLTQKLHIYITTLNLVHYNFTTVMNFKG